jgi:hypothetical protein
LKSFKYTVRKDKGRIFIFQPRPKRCCTFVTRTPPTLDPAALELEDVAELVVELAAVLEPKLPAAPPETGTGFGVGFGSVVQATKESQRFHSGQSDSRSGQFEKHDT